MRGMDASDDSAPPVDRALLEREYFHIQKALDSFDSKSLMIKAWSVSLSMAGIGVAYMETAPVLLLLSGASALLFWVIEGLWKTFQYAYYARIFEIEGYLSGERQKIKAPQIGVSWSRSFREGGARRLWKVLTWPHVALPHVAVGFGGVLLYLWARPA